MGYKITQQGENNLKIEKTATTKICDERNNESFKVRPVILSENVFHGKLLSFKLP